VSFISREKAPNTQPANILQFCPFRNSALTTSYSTVPYNQLACDLRYVQ